MADDMIRDPELALSLAHVPLPHRPAVAALWRLDERLAEIAGGANPPTAAIKLAWWREALERLDRAPPPAEPLLQAIAVNLLPAGVSGAELAGIAAGWDALLDGSEDEQAMLDRHARGRGGTLFAIIARLLGGADSVDVITAGEIWALTHIGATHLRAGRQAASRRGRQSYWPRRLRALGVLAVLGRDDMVHPDARSGSPRRVARALWHAISGY